MAESKTCGVLSPTLSYSNDEKTRKSLPQRPNAFVIDWGEKKDSSLQEAFLKFQKERQREVRQTRKMRKKRRVKKDPAKLNALRAKFIEQAKKYFGVPYARKYWAKETPEYSSPMFLDCCGLVRQVVRDMKKDLGFRLGPWNQSYMFDTLPISVPKEKMKPGDLVFMSGIYTNPKSKKQRHNMTHVEIWLGEGEKTIGARWNNGKVQIFDSYKFSAKSFHSERYYFKSIDTWLMGICKSYCPIHPWKRSKFNPSKKSVFNPAPEQSDQTEPDEAASGEEADLDTPTSSGLDFHEDILTPLSTVSSSNPDLDSVDISDCPETPASDRDEIFERKISVDIESNFDEYLTSGSESDLGDNEQPLDTYSQEERLKVPAVAFSYILDSDDDDDFGSGISYIHTSKSSGCLSLKPPRAHPSMSSSSLPELELEEPLSLGSLDVYTAWNQPKFQAKSSEVTYSSQRDLVDDDGAQASALKSDDIPHFCLGNEINTDIYGSLIKNERFETTSIPNSKIGQNSFKDDFYCVAECGSTTCDPDMEQDEYVDSNYDLDEDETCDFRLFESLPETWIDPVQNDHILRETTVESRLSLISCTSEEEPPVFSPKPPRTVKSLPIISAVDVYHPRSSISSGFPVTVKSSPSFLGMKEESGNSKLSAYSRSGKSSPSIITLMVGDGGVMKVSPQDADTKQTDNSKSTINSSSQIGGSDSTPSGGDGGSGRRDGDRSPGRSGGKKTPGGRPTKLPTCSLANNMTPSFYIGGGNGVSLVEAPLLELGWKRTADKYDERFRLKWVECKSRINYSAFREGDQLVNHIANCQLLTNKMGLLNSLQEYERVTLSTKGRLPRLKMAEFVPETYRLDNRDDRETFLEVYKDNEIWISKPTGMNQGKGIFLLRTKEEIDKLLSERDAKQQQSKPSRPLMSRIVQRYIHNPLLLDERKFDIRAYMLIASTVPYLVLYHKGYIRLSCQKYDGEDTNLSTHLTNQFIQKKVPNYSEVKEETAWSMDKFNDYINEKVAPEKGIEQDWTYNYLTKQMQRIMLHCFNSVKHKLQCKVGFFDLYGLDFMIDQDMKVWLIEININPCLATNCTALFDVIPNMVKETIYISLECFEKGRKNQKLLPLNSLKSFSVLYCGSNPNAVTPRQTRSVSPAKDNTSDKSKSNASPSAPRRGPSPTRQAAPRMAIASTTFTQSPYQQRKTEFSTILNQQLTANGKALTSARGQRTNGVATKSAGTSRTGNSGTDRSKVNSVNKDSSGQAAKSDAKTSASNKTGDSKTSSDAKASSDAKTSSNAKTTSDAKTSSNAKASIDAKVSSDAKTTSDAKTSSNAKGSSDAKISSDAKTSSETKTSSNAKASSDAKTSSEAKASSVAKSSGDVKTRKGSGGTSPKSDSSDKSSNQSKSSASEKTSVPVPKVAPTTKASPSNSKGNSTNGAKSASQEKTNTSGIVPKVQSNSSSKPSASNPPKAKNVGKSASAEKVGKETDNQTKKDKPSSPPKDKTSRKPGPESKTKPDSPKTKVLKSSDSGSKSSKSDSASKSHSPSKPDSNPKADATSKSNPTSPKLNLKSNSSSGKPEASQPVDKVDTTMSSHQGNDEDVKLKMTHATDSASRKNRPRAETGN